MRYAFPITLVVLDLCAAVVYAWHGDWRRAIYWVAASTLTLCVTMEK